MRQAINHLSTTTLAQDTDLETIYVTLVAIHVLQEAFEHKCNEWTLLARKAKTYLKQVGVSKPEKLLNLFTLQPLA